MLTRRWSSKAIWMRSGCSSGSICWVLLVSGRFPLSKTIIPDAKEHFPTHSPRRDAHPFGGLGVRESDYSRSQDQQEWWQWRDGKSISFYADHELYEWGLNLEE